ncbi:hypothetical protein WG66_000356 [Moniliophthora roreri]|nr:hypothetical protein WG66_000356 [Moniliophthora roreri]
MPNTTAVWLFIPGFRAHTDIERQHAVMELQVVEPTGLGIYGRRYCAGTVPHEPPQVILYAHKEELPFEDQGL